jgi:hypothetical protein
MSPIQSWSHSRAILFEQCKYRAFLMHVEKIPEPERPLPPGKTEQANDRGTRIHEGCEGYIKGTGPLPFEAAKHFRVEFDALKQLFTEGRVSVEGEWALNRAWEPTGWRGAWELVEGALPAKPPKLPEFGKAGDLQTFKIGGQECVYTWVPAWLRLKLDSMVHISENEAIAIDFKSGKKFGNELKHAEQLQLYQLVCFLRYPKLEIVHTELWYLDVDDLTRQTFTRAQGLRFQRSWDKRGNNLTTCQDFPPNPNIFSCKWCGYGPWGTGHCAKGKK